MLQNIKAYVEHKHPIKNNWKNNWVFDDPEKGLQKEGLVLGVDDYLDALCHKYHIQEEYGVSINFSHDPYKIAYDDKINYRSTMLTNRVVYLKLLCEYNDGYTYLIKHDPVLKREDQTLWLCANLLRYFEKPPEFLHVSFDEVKVIDIAKLIAKDAGKLLILSSHMETIDKAMLPEQFLDGFSPLLGKYPSIKWSEYHLIAG